MESTEGETLPYKIVDGSREKRFGVVASSLHDLVKRACEKLDLSGGGSGGGSGGIKVVLEQDGTEVDEEDYFSTLEKNTSLMLLTPDQRWAPPGRFRKNGGGRDTVDSGSGRGLEGLLNRLQTDIGHVSLLGGYELELLSDMDPESLTDIVPDKNFLDQLKEASGRFLSDKRQAQEAMDLLKIYHRTTTGAVHQDAKRGTVAQ